LRKELFQPTLEAEGRILLLIDAFSSKSNSGLEGRTKLAKLDFFVRYPKFLKRALDIKGVDAHSKFSISESNDIESRMVRYKFGPWDPSYFSLLGRLIGKKLIQVTPTSKGLNYKTTSEGHMLARKLADQDCWSEIEERISLLKRNFNLSGSALKNFIYQNFPEVSESKWGDEL